MQTSLSSSSAQVVVATRKESAFFVSPISLWGEIVGRFSASAGILLLLVFHWSVEDFFYLLIIEENWMSLFLSIDLFICVFYEDFPFQIC